MHPFAPACERSWREYLSQNSFKNTKCQKPRKAYQNCSSICSKSIDFHVTSKTFPYWGRDGIPHLALVDQRVTCVHLVYQFPGFFISKTAKLHNLLCTKITKNVSSRNDFRTRYTQKCVCGLTALSRPLAVLQGEVEQAGQGGNEKGKLRRREGREGKENRGR